MVSDGGYNRSSYDRVDATRTEPLTFEREDGFVYDAPPPPIEPRRLDFLILALPDGNLGHGEVVSLSLREGIDFIDEVWWEFGDFYVLETA
jgi:hypothetical protein